MEYVGFIYMWTNIENNRKYIGSHKGNIDDSYIGSGKRFKNAVKNMALKCFDVVY